MKSSDLKSFLVIWCLLVVLIHPVAGSLANESSDDIREVQVGAILPLDGSWANVGRDSEVALNLSMDAVNDHLASDHLKIVLHVENSHSDPKKALQAIQKFHAEGIRTVIGPCSSAEAAAVVPYANENGIVLLSPSSTAVSLALDDNLFRLAPNDTYQAEALAQLIRRQNFTQVLVVYMDDEYGSGMYAGLKERSSDPGYGFDIIDAVPYDPAITTYDPLIEEITAASEGMQTDSGAIVLIGTGSHGAGIFTAAGIQSPLSEYKWFSGDGIIREAEVLNTATSGEFAAKTRLEGFTFACEETLTIVPTMLAAGLMSAELGMAPSPDALPAWDAIWIIAETYRLDPDADLQDFISNMRSVCKRNVNVFNQFSELDENGDIMNAKYARFQAVKSSMGVIFWNLTGMFIKNKTAGAFITDTEGTLTREFGDVVIGAVLPITGPDAETGKGAQDAIDLALTQATSYYTKTAGLNINFMFDIRDSASDPATTLTQVKKLHEAGVTMMLLGGNSADLSAVQQYCKDNQIIVLGTRSTAVTLADSDDLIYRLTPDDSNQAKALVRLIEAQGKKHLVILYRDDVYGQGLQEAISEVFTGEVDRYSYPVYETDFSSLVKIATAAVEKTGRYEETAVVVIGLTEVVRLLETVEDGPLTSVSWYGTDGIAQSRNLLSSPHAVSNALKTNLTCATFDIYAQKVFSPMHQMSVSYLSQAIGDTTVGWNEISNYDAAWMAMNAYALTSPDANSRELWSFINNPYGAGGIAGLYVVNDAQDQSLSMYSFYTVTSPSTKPEWEVTAYYRDVLIARDELIILTP